MDLIALDFETATPRPDSACELGLAIVRGGEVAEVRQWLIKPPQWPWFSPYNVAVHGIRPQDVAGAPRWTDIWPEVATLLHGNTVVAHNAAFDMAVLRGTLAAHGLRPPAFQYFCSVSMARRVWPGHRSYGLGPLCAHHGIPLRHHRAGDDAEATARVVIRAWREVPVPSVTDFLQHHRVKLGGFGPMGHRTPGGKVTPIP